MTTEFKQVLARLDYLQGEIEYIKEHMVDTDCILDVNDLEAIKQAEKDEKEGGLVSLDQLKKKLRI